MSRIDHLISQNDAVLARFISAPDQNARDGELESLLTRIATPTMDRVLSRMAWQLSRSDREDVRSIIQLRVLRKLSALSEDSGETIRKFNDYVATLTFHTVFDMMRMRFPQRRRLKGRLRYILTHDPRFAVWPVSGVYACGIAAWRERTDYRERPVRIDHMGSDRILEQFVEHCFRSAGVPLSLDALTDSVAAAAGIDEQLPAIDLATSPSSAPPLDQQIEQRELVRHVWSEIEALPVNQRVALLLNLRDPTGMNAIAVLCAAGGISPDAIAAAIGLSAEQLGELWNTLPLDDLTIAARLGVTRQQVINLRQAARSRIARRIAARNRRRGGSE